MQPAFATHQPRSMRPRNRITLVILHAPRLPGWLSGFTCRYHSRAYSWRPWGVTSCALLRHAGRHQNGPGRTSPGADSSRTCSEIVN